MLNILTLKVGAKYGPEYVNRLYRGIARHTTVPFRFFCYTEDQSGLIPEVRVAPLRLDRRVAKQWYKIDLHCPETVAIEPGSKCLILDIDLIVVSNLDDLFGWNLNRNEMGLFRRWWSGSNRACCELNGGFQLFYMGDTENLYSTFYAQPEHWQQCYISRGEAEGPVNGEQNFINEHLLCEPSWLPDQWFAKYAPQRLTEIQRAFNQQISRQPMFENGRFYESIKLVHFANANNAMGHINEPWISQYWHDEP